MSLRVKEAVLAVLAVRLLPLCFVSLASLAVDLHTSLFTAQITQVCLL